MDLSFFFSRLRIAAAPPRTRHNSVQKREIARPTYRTKLLHSTMSNEESVEALNERLASLEVLLKEGFTAVRQEITALRQEIQANRGELATVRQEIQINRGEIITAVRQLIVGLTHYTAHSFGDLTNHVVVVYNGIRDIALAALGIPFPEPPMETNGDNAPGANNNNNNNNNNDDVV